jgi:hypothetical protein
MEPTPEITDDILELLKRNRKFYESLVYEIYRVDSNKEDSLAYIVGAMGKYPEFKRYVEGQVREIRRAEQREREYNAYEAKRLAPQAAATAAEKIASIKLDSILKANPTLDTLVYHREIDPSKKDADGNTLLHNIIIYYGKIKNGNHDTEKLVPNPPGEASDFIDKLSRRIHKLLIVDRYEIMKQVTTGMYEYHNEPTGKFVEKHPTESGLKLINEVNNKGETPLMLACAYGLVDVIEDLLYCRAKVMIRSKPLLSKYRGDTALRYLYNYIDFYVKQENKTQTPQVIGMNSENPKEYLLHAEIRRLKTASTNASSSPETKERAAYKLKLYELYNELMIKGATAGGRRKTKRRSSSKMTRRRKYKKDC